MYLPDFSSVMWTMRRQTGLLQSGSSAVKMSVSTFRALASASFGPRALISPIA